MIGLYIASITIAFFLGMFVASIFSPLKSEALNASFELDRLEHALKQSRESAKYWAVEHLLASQRDAHKTQALEQIAALANKCDLMSIRQICNLARTYTPELSEIHGDHVKEFEQAMGDGQ